MDKRKKIVSYLNKGVEVSTQLLVEKHLPLFILPLTLVVWVIEKWVFSFSNWVPLVVTVWATIQYSSYQRQIHVKDLNRKWKQVILRCQKHHWSTVSG
ncbi:hypothetical protein CsSME_00037953 [Camellia sinensis var. sinensis]